MSARYDIRRVDEVWCVYDKHRRMRLRPVATFPTLHEAEQYVIGHGEVAA